MERRCPPVDLRAGLRQSEAPPRLPSLNVHPTHRAHSRSHFKDTALREQGAAETILTAYETEPRYGLSINFKILAGGCGDLLSCSHPRQASHVSSLAFQTSTYPAGMACLFLQSTLPSGYRAVLDSPPGAL